MSSATGNKAIDLMMTAAVIGLLGWNLITTQNLTVQVGKLEERMELVTLLKTLQDGNN